jgi:hypothetical protein
MQGFVTEPKSTSVILPLLEIIFSQLKPPAILPSILFLSLLSHQQLLLSRQQLLLSHQQLLLCGHHSRLSRQRSLSRQHALPTNLQTNPTRYRNEDSRMIVI